MQKSMTLSWKASHNLMFACLQNGNLEFSVIARMGKSFWRIQWFLNGSVVWETKYRPNGLDALCFCFFWVNQRLGSWCHAHRCYFFPCYQQSSLFAFYVMELNNYCTCDLEPLWGIAWDSQLCLFISQRMLDWKSQEVNQTPGFFRTPSTWYLGWISHYLIKLFCTKPSSISQKYVLQICHLW